MIKVLPKKIKAFPGPLNHTRCFNHMAALVAKRIVRQFNVTGNKDKDMLDDAERELWELAEGIDVEEAATQNELEVSEDEDSDDKDGEWCDEIMQLSEDERQELNDSLQPVRSLLVKVSNYHIVESNVLTQLTQLHKISFAIIHSTTILLPLWFTTLEKLKLDKKKMPHDVRTRWNSTYDMVQFALQYHSAIDNIARNKTAGLC
jgi:hypothetical protein